MATIEAQVIEGIPLLLSLSSLFFAAVSLRRAKLKIISPEAAEASGQLRLPDRPSGQFIPAPPRSTSEVKEYLDLESGEAGRRRYDDDQYSRWLQEKERLEQLRGTKNSFVDS